MKTFLIIFSMMFFIAGCSSNVKVFHSTNSLGKQIDDLNKAYENHVITKYEYKKAKEILIDHYK